MELRNNGNQDVMLDVLSKIEAHLAALRANANQADRTWLTIREAADVLRVSRDTIERMITSGRLRAARIDTCIGKGKRVRYRIRREWLDECLNETKSPIRNTRQFKRRRGKTQPIDFIG